ncbi:hypothetical protein V8F20_003647 [Naviculisporaceae sp. PSN 640]
MRSGGWNWGVGRRPACVWIAPLIWKTDPSDELPDEVSIVMGERAEWRGLPSEVRRIQPPQPLPLQCRYDDQCKAIDKEFGPSTLVRQAREILERYITDEPPTSTNHSVSDMGVGKITENDITKISDGKLVIVGIDPHDLAPASMEVDTRKNSAAGLRRALSSSTAGGEGTGVRFRNVITSKYISIPIFWEDIFQQHSFRNVKQMLNGSHRPVAILAANPGRVQEERAQNLESLLLGKPSALPFPSEFKEDGTILSTGPHDYPFANLDIGAEMGLFQLPVWDNTNGATSPKSPRPR